MISQHLSHINLHAKTETDCNRNAPMGRKNVATGGAKRNPWGFLPQKPFPFANSSTGYTSLDVVECRSTRGYNPLPHPGQNRKDRSECIILR